MSKLRPAVAPAHQLVPRERLHRLLDESVKAPLTLVVAPAGSGKTVLVATWAAHSEVPNAWIALDESDRDPVQLWRSLVAALEILAPGCAQVAAAALRQPGRLLDGVGALLDDLEGRRSPPKVLVVDDFYLVDDVEVAAGSLAFFVQHLPPWLHVLLISRRDLPLPVDRLRARGQVGEVHFSELRFSLDEAAAMLSKLAPMLDPDVVAEIATAARGWAASIQFAALAARSARARGLDDPPDLDDSVHYLEDYLWREVLAKERPEVVDVLMATSVAKRVDAGLARLLASRPDAADLLTVAEHRGLFVSRIEPSAEFEVHALVRERLLSVLARESPERLRQLYSMAAHWCQGRGETLLALSNWLRAGRPRDALRLLAAELPALYDSGHDHMIAQVVAAIPDAMVSEGPEVGLEFAWCHLLVDRRRFGALVEDLGHRFGADPELDPVLAARLAMLQSIAASLRGDWVAGASLARSALEELGDLWWLDPQGRFAWNMIGREVALSERWDEPAAETQEVMTTVAIAPDRRFALEGTRALGEALAGRPIDALRVAAGVNESSDVANMPILWAEVSMARAIAYREVGELPVALPLLHELVIDHLQPTVHCQLLAWFELVEARITEGNLETATEAFEHVTELVTNECSGPHARSRLARTGTVLSLAHGRVAEAGDWANRVEDRFWSAISTARVLLASDDAGHAYDALQEAHARCQRHRVILGLLMSQAAAAASDREKHLADAVEVAASHGLVQTVADEGSTVLEAVERLAWQAPAGWLARVRRAVATEAERRIAPQDLVEPLTERELQVLRLLPSRLTLREVADELFISPNTLKFHLKVIYRKLGCGSRAEAVEVARTLSSPRTSAQRSSITRYR